VQGVGISSDVAVRTAGMSALVGAYRATHGAFSLPKGTIIKVVWKDGSPSLEASLPSRSPVLNSPPVAEVAAVEMAAAIPEVPVAAVAILGAAAALVVAERAL